MKFLWLVVVISLFTGCSVYKTEKKKVNEDYAYKLSLSEKVSDRNGEYSGLCWYEDDLVLLPQYPSYFRKESGRDLIFLASKEEIAKSIKKKGEYNLALKEVEVINNLTYKILPGYEGFEAICYDGEYFFLSIEYNTSAGEGVVVKAKMSDNKRELTILNDEYIKVPLASDIFNASYESMFCDDNYLYLIYEGNGKRVNKRAVVKKIAKDFSSIEDITMDSIEYRITDVTTFDESGDGWAINYFWPGNYKSYHPEDDTISNEYLDINNIEQGIERIIPLTLTDNGVIYDKSREPIYIKREFQDYSNNWEGIVRYKDKGFLIITDKFPTTVFQYIKNNRK